MRTALRVCLRRDGGTPRRRPAVLSSFGQLFSFLATLALTSHEQEGEAQVPGVVRHARLLKGPLHIPPKILRPLRKLFREIWLLTDPDCAIDRAALGACRVGRALGGSRSAMAISRLARPA